MIVIDTSILIDYLRTKRDEQSPFEAIVAREKRTNLGISILTVQELYEGKSIADPENEKVLLSVISSFKILPYTYEVAKRAGEIGRNLDRLIGFADAAIAATAIINGASLATLNKRDFAGIAGLELINVHAGASTALTPKEK